MRLIIEDRSGVIAQLGEVFARYDISLKSLKQRGELSSGKVEFTFMTHRTTEAKMQKALRDIDQLEVASVASVLRVEDL